MLIDFECDSNCNTIEFLGRSIRLKGLYHSEILNQIQNQILYSLLPEFMEQTTPIFWDSKYLSEKQE
jgi:hypothetical protein